MRLRLVTMLRGAVILACGALFAAGAHVAATHLTEVQNRKHLDELDWTILRPGGLTFEEGTSRVALGDSVPRGSIAREDVARLIAECIAEPASIGHQWEVVAGDTPLEDAVREAAAASPA